MILITQLMHEIKRLQFVPKTVLFFLSFYSLAVFAYSTYGGVTGPSDIYSFFSTSKLLINKIDPYKLSVDYIKRVPEINFKGLDQNGGRSLYPPSTHIIFSPFLISQEFAKISWLIWNFVFIAIIFYTIYRRYLLQSPLLFSYLFLLLIIGSYATKSCLRYGQTSLFSFAAFTLTLMLKDRYKWLSGILFALAMTKPSLMVLFALYFLFKKEYLIVFTAFMIHGLIIVALGFWIGESPLSLINNYAEKVSLLTNTHPSPFRLGYLVTGISFKSLFHLFQIPSTFITIITSILYLITSVYIYNYRRFNEIYILGFIGLASMLIDYHWHYDFVVLFLLFPVFIKPFPGKAGLQWPLFYYLFLMYMPDFTFVGDFLKTHINYWIVWHLMYTGFFLILLWIFMKCSAPKAGEYCGDWKS